MATTKKVPQDHKPPQDKTPEPVGFTFEHDGETFHIPPPSEALTRLPGRALRDALLGGQEGELKLAFRCVESVGIAPDALDALYTKPVPDMTATLLAWFRSADQSGATLPQS